MGPSKMVALVVLAAAAHRAESTVPVPPVAADAAFVAVVKDGRLDDGRWVGTHASQLMAHVLSTFPALEPGWELGLPTVVDGSSLRYLVLDGAYLADVPLLLPSLCVLQLTPTATIMPAANLTLKNTTSFTGLVSLWDVHFSAVIGGTIDASSLPAAAIDYPYARGYMAVAIKGGGNNAVRHVRAASNNSDGVLGITKSPNSEIANVDVGGGGSSGHGMTSGRCIWILATSRALVHDNWVRNCSAHALDLDAYTSSSAAYNNLCEDNREEGIFVEETASGNFIFNNTVRRNGCGIGVYSMAVGPVANNMIIANVLESNWGNAISAGGYGHSATKQSEGNIFASNSAANNAGHDGGQYALHHGATLHDFWIDNTVTGDAPGYCLVPSPGNVTQVVVFEPRPVSVP